MKKQILERAADGYIPSPEEALLLMGPEFMPLDELIHAAGAITKQYHGSRVKMCAIHAVKVGRCSGDCAFCAQSSHHNCHIHVVKIGDISYEKIASHVRLLEKNGVERFSLVTSGERLTDEEFSHILQIYRRLHNETGIGLCASLGSLDQQRAQALAACGVTRYHHNIETAPSYFPQICSTHSYKDKLETIRIAREAGMEICCGGIISMGETSRQRVEMAYALQKLHADCVPVNILNPIPGTRLEHQPLLSTDEILRTIALFRLVMPKQTLCFAGGRQNAMGDDEYAGYEAGINALIIGDFLTTQGKELREEISKLTALGRV